jgi:type IV secretion system protein VirD4
LTTRTPATYPGPEPGILLIAGAVVAGAVLWGGGALSALLVSDRVPSHRPLAGVDALAHFSDPAIAWGAPVGPVVLYWCVVATVLLILAAFVLVTWRLIVRRRRSDADDPSRIEGLASRSQVAAAAGARILVARAKILRPTLKRAQPREVGLSLGKSQGVECWVSVEDSIFVLGPPRSGKGLHLVIPAILDYPGAVITTATRPDNLAVTLAVRSNVGPVGVFDPQGLATGVSAAMRWSPVRGCERAQTALIRAAALCEDTGEEVESGSFWRQQTITVLRCLLHAAALGERAATDLYRWSLSPAAAREAVEILVRTHGAARDWDRPLARWDHLVR